TGESSFRRKCSSISVAERSAGSVPRADPDMIQSRFRLFFLATVLALQLRRRRWSDKGRVAPVPVSSCCLWFASLAAAFWQLIEAFLLHPSVELKAPPSSSQFWPTM